MGNNISLTASMRSNLLSLQNISRQVSSTQNKLATGNKVNSAIDNPSSYYTARSLNNRANDLDALLDSMGQAVSTIKTATTALETGATFLEQAAAVATSALEISTIPAKSYFEEKVGEDGAVVTTAQELKDAINSGKETICIFGQIDYFEDETIRLNGYQKLVGTEYFTGYTGKEKFSQLNISNCLNMVDFSLVSDLTINANTTHQGPFYSIACYGNSSLNNLTLNSSVTIDGGASLTAGILASASSLNLSGTIIVNQQSNANTSYGIYNFNHSTINTSADIYTTTIVSDSATLNVNSGTINLTDKLVRASSWGPEVLNVASGAEINEQIAALPTPSQVVDSKVYSQQYAEILRQYDDMVKDSSYKGINLLKSENLSVRFNENGSAGLNVIGRDMSTDALGLSRVDWTNQGDITSAIKELSAALKSIRAYTAELGNNYSIITSRQSFTENLINVLTEGADKLTLADMNEESANMLALQTRQQLAINSLSLAAQGSQSILKLF